MIIISLLAHAVKNNFLLDYKRPLHHERAPPTRVCTPSTYNREDIDQYYLSLPAISLWQPHLSLQHTPVGKSLGIVKNN